MLRISYFWPDWNSYVRLGVFHTIFSTKRSHPYFSPKICLKFLMIRFLTSVAYCSTTCTLHEYAHPVIYNNPEFHSYRTAVMLSDLDFVAPNNEHIFFMRWHQTRVKTVGAMGVSYDMLIVSPAQKIGPSRWVSKS